MLRMLLGSGRNRKFARLRGLLLLISRTGTPYSGRISATESGKQWEGLKMAWMKQELFERGIAILSFDTEQIWGHADYFNEAQFLQRYPGALEAHDRLLDGLCAADIPATWFLVGGMALSGSKGSQDGRMADLPAAWTCKVPAGSERTAPEWYRHPFVKRLKGA